VEIHKLLNVQLLYFENENLITTYKQIGALYSCIFIYFIPRVRKAVNNCLSGQAIKSVHVRVCVVRLCVCKALIALKSAQDFSNL